MANIEYTNLYKTKMIFVFFSVSQMSVFHLHKLIFWRWNNTHGNYFQAKCNYFVKKASSFSFIINIIFKKETNILDGFDINLIHSRC